MELLKSVSGRFFFKFKICNLKYLKSQRGDCSKTQYLCRILLFFQFLILSSSRPLLRHLIDH